MKIVISIYILFFCISSFASIFDEKDKVKLIEVNLDKLYYLKFSHESGGVCNSDFLNKGNIVDICKHPRKEDVIVEVIDDEVSYLVDVYRVDGASPEVINVFSFDVDSDGVNELFIQIMSRIRHRGEGISYDEINLYSYGTGGNGRKGNYFKRLIYIEKEYSDFADIDLEDKYKLLNISNIERILNKIKNKNYSDDNLNDLGEFWYRKRNNYDIAISYFEAAVKKNQKYVPALSNLGIAYQKVGLYEEAISAAEKAIKLTDDPNVKASSHYNIAKAYEENRNWLPALENYKKAKSYRKHSAYEKGINRVMGVVKKNENKN